MSNTAVLHSSMNQRSMILEVIEVIKDQKFILDEHMVRALKTTHVGFGLAIIYISRDTNCY